MGSGPSLLTIGPAAHPILRHELGLTSVELRRLRHAFVPSLWRHEAAVREFRLTLETACERLSQVTLSEWVNESELRRSPFKVALAKQTVELVPDGVFTLALADGRTKRCYLELDRATEQSPVRFKRKLLAYFAHVGQSATPVLLVVPTKARRKQLAAWIGAAAQDLKKKPTLFAIGLVEEVSERTILETPVWHVVGDSPLALLPQEQPARSPTCEVAQLQGGLHA